MNLRNSVAAALGAMILMLVVIIVAMCMRVVSGPWEYVVIFLGFMTVFCHLASVLLRRSSAAAARKLDFIALIFGVAAVVALIVVFIINWCDFY